MSIKFNTMMIFLEVFFVAWSREGRYHDLLSMDINETFWISNISQNMLKIGQEYHIRIVCSELRLLRFKATFLNIFGVTASPPLSIGSYIALSPNIVELIKITFTA
jgi:hypothetical protein